MKLKTVIFFAAIITLFLFCSCSSNSNHVTINVYNWGEYISTGTDDTLDVNKEFTNRTGINVNYTTFSSNEELYAKLSSKGAVYDVIIPSDYMISKLINEGLLQKLDFSQIPNISYIDNRFKKMNYDPDNSYSVAYTWGCTGIFYNRDMIDECKIDWNILWNEKYKGKILMFDNPRDAFAISQILLGIDFNSTKKDDWTKSAEMLKAQKSILQSYVMDQIFNKMGNNEAAVAPYYSGDAIRLLEENSSLEFVIPKEGTNLFVDAMCIPSNSNHVSEAMQYINFMCEPEIALANIETIGYSTPSTEVRNMLDDETANNPILYPSDEYLENAQSFSNLPEDVSLYVNKLWIDVKTGNEDNPIGLAVVIAVFLAFYVAVIIYKRKKQN